MSKFSIGCMNQLGDALFKAGFWTDGYITELKQNPLLLSQIREVMLGTAKICYVISGDDDLAIPDGFKLEQEFTNNFLWDSGRFEAFVSKNQKNGTLVTIKLLCSYVKILRPMNAAVANLLVNHQWLIDEIIPEDSEITRILFLGTVYMDCNSNQYVSALKKNPNRSWKKANQAKWGLVYESINDVCDKNTVVALLD
jgi:hypothetical protein